MKKVSIIHNSKFGNSKRIADKIAESFSGKFSISVNHMKEINPKDIADNLYGLIIATRIVSFRANSEIRKYIKKISSIRNEPIPKVAVYYTHGTKWKEHFKKTMEKTLDKTENIENVFSESLKVRVKGSKGPIIDGQEQKINDFINNLEVYLEN